MSENSKRILAIFAHADDELGCVGTLANHADAGDEVTLLFLTRGENATTVMGNNDETMAKRQAHTDKISELLGVTIRFLDFPDSNIPYTVDGGYKIAEVIKEIRPHVIISWNQFTNMGAGHPDHRHTASLVFDAINYARYTRNDSPYEPFRDPISFYRYRNDQANARYSIQYVDISHQSDKIEQFIQIYSEAYGDWPVKKFKFTTARYYGYQLGVELAESFEIVNRVESIPKLLM
ncbi:MAG: PIG-L deacetylase family protein [Candidatus Kariarchaeaceae archaeon]|jgi:LmbE family N-acetylglucosaminyl deacetylase